MPCYHPLPGWYSKERNASGKRSIVFSIEQGFKDRKVEVPCGTCIGCRLERARQWAVRCMHEAKLWESNCFVTLTYDDAHVPKDMSLRPRDFVLFMKRLRHEAPGVRFLQCGEYGDKYARPHHHAILFNCGFADRVRLKYKDGVQLWKSERLDSLWGQGFCTIGEVTFQSAGYVARYSLKKVLGPAADLHYGARVPEYMTMSRRPGIGHDWVVKYMSDYYPSDEVVVDGKVCKPPRYYDTLYERFDAVGMRRIRAQRCRARAEDVDSTGRRLTDREVVKESAITHLSRDLEV